MKKSPSNGDAAFERQVRQALEAHIAPGPSGASEHACLDPETLAAWADDELDARERAAAEAHAADCSRCQALLAAMIRTTEPAAEATRWWRLRAVKWLAPLTAVAAALVVWAIVPSPPNVQPGDRVVPAARETTRAPASSVDRLSESQALVQVPSEPAKKPGASPAPTDSANAHSVASPSDADAAPRQGTAETLQQAAPPKAAQESFARLLRREGNSPEIVSANPSFQWRIVPGGAVQRSTDGGSTWETQQTGVSVTLVTGASPFPAVCWLVGPGGIVLLQTDGRSWRRIAFPEPTDLASVRASDENTATVTTADGRVFSTMDGGLTWTPSPRV